MSSNNTQGIYSQDSLIIPFGYRYVAKSPTLRLTDVLMSTKYE